MCSIFVPAWIHQVDVTPSVKKLVEIYGMRVFLVNLLCANLGKCRVTTHNHVSDHLELCCWRDDAK